MSTQLRDFVYYHHELWANVRARARGDSHTSNNLSATLAWVSARQRVRRLRVAVDDNAWRHSYPSADDFCAALVEDLAGCLQRLPILTSLEFVLGDDNPFFAYGPVPLGPLLRSATPALRQLCIRAGEVHLPAEAASLTLLTALQLASPSGGLTLAAGALPPGLKHLRLSGLQDAALPASLLALSQLESLTVDWAGDRPAVEADLSLLEHSSSPSPSNRNSWTQHLTHLSLGYFTASALPATLPEGLRSLEIKWNVQTTEWECRRRPAAEEVDAFHASFEALRPLRGLTHLCLNNALGGWGLPSAVLELTQLESLGVAGVNPFSDWSGRAAPITPQLRRFSRLRRLDIELYEAASGWQDLAALTGLQQLRLGKSGEPEEYVQPEVRGVVGGGLVHLLPALRSLTAVETEGMLLPATPTCARWNRLLGFEAPELREAAVAAVGDLHARGVALGRWYSWPFWPNDEGAGAGWVAWDEV